MYIRSLVASLALAFIGIMASGCGYGGRSDGGLRLPEGDVVAGKAAFSDLGCVQCHSVRGEEDLPAPVEPTNMELGGRLYSATSYGQLVTAIINPSHSISARAPREVREAGSTPMTSFNESMTVAQLIDLVAFLHSKYTQLGSGYNPVPF